MGPARGLASGVRRTIALVVYIIVILVAAPQAQQPVAFTGAPGAMVAGPAVTPSDATNVDLLVGRSTILNVGSPIARVSLTVPDVADAMVTAPNQLLIHGKTPGTISLFVWDRAGGISTYEINVRRDLKQLTEQMQQLFPGEPIAVVGSGRDVIISGTVSSKYVIDKASDVAAGYVEKKENVVNLLKQQEGVASNQVMLRVRFAEVSRSAMQELGASLVANGTSGDLIGRTTTQQFAAPDFDSTKPNGLTFSDFLNIFLFNSKHNIGAVVRALQSKGLFQSLAEPNLIATNGKEASFLAGGEYPYPVAQGGSNSNAITIVFKEFGVRLTFTPTVLGGDLINLKVKPEVSALDFANGITMSGIRVPALSTRRTETEVELQDGQTFAIAGLLNNTVTNTMSKIPGVGDIPILGYLFRSRSFQKNETELVVMITPQIIRRGSMGVSQGLPAAVEPYLAPTPKPLPQPAPYVGSPRYPTQPQASPRREETPAPAAVPTAPVTTAAPVAPSVKGVPQAQPTETKTETKKAGATAQAIVPPPPAAVPAELSPVSPAAVAPQPVPAPKPTKAELKAAEQQREKDQKAAAQKADADKKAAAVAAKEKKASDAKAAEEKKISDAKAAELKKISDAKAAEDKARQDKLDAERAKREAIVAKKAAEQDKKDQDEQKKHDKAIADAAAKLKLAQDAYQTEVSKNKTAGGTDKN